MTVHTLTCGDLAALGGPWDRLHQHDPDRQSVEHDTLCYCRISDPPTEREIRCLELRLEPIGDYLIRLCCLCSPQYGDVLRARHREHAADNLFQWVREQCQEAIAYRDQRSLDGSACPRDMDVEAGVVEVEHA